MMEIRERSPSMLRNVDGDPLDGVGVGDSVASIINAKKY
jgi:hypothetical protein